MPKEKAPVVGFPTVPCSICTKPTDMTALALCGPCWELKQRLENYAPMLMRRPEARAAVVALLERALDTKFEPATEGT